VQQFEYFDFRIDCLTAHTQTEEVTSLFAEVGIIKLNTEYFVMYNSEESSADMQRRRSRTGLELERHVMSCGQLAKDPPNMPCYSD